MKRFWVRDIETHKILTENFNLGTQKDQIYTCDFSSVTAANAHIVFLEREFGLGQYYEIWDDKEQEVIDYRSYFNKTAKNPEKDKMVKNR